MIHGRIGGCLRFGLGCPGGVTPGAAWGVRLSFLWAPTFALLATAPIVWNHLLDRKRHTETLEQLSAREPARES